MGFSNGRVGACLDPGPEGKPAGVFIPVQRGTSVWACMGHCSTLRPALSLLNTTFGPFNQLNGLHEVMRHHNAL